MGGAFCKLLVSVSSLSVQACQAYPVCSLDESTPGRKLHGGKSFQHTETNLHIILNKKQLQVFKCCKRACPQL